MMMIKNSRVFWVSILLLVVTGCRNQVNSRKEEMFARIFPSTEMNKQLELQVPKTIFGESPEGEITLNLFNRSSNQIILPDTLNYLIFFYSDEDGWQEIRNLYSRKGGEVILEPKESEWWKSSKQVYGRPDPKETEGKNYLRMVVLGFIYQNGKATNIQVGAFVDVNLRDYIKSIVK
jgi:hypothetical protein